MWTLEPAAGRRSKAAVRFLLAGSDRDRSVDVRAEGFYEAARRSGGEGPRLWWARRDRTPLAAAMIVPRPGRIGLVFFSPPEAPGVDAGALAALLEAITRSALGEGLCMVQALLRVADARQVEVLRRAGYQELAELIYMQKALPPDAAPPPPRDGEAGLSWRGREQFTERQLADVIAATYEDSLDCPALCRMRDVADAIESHKATGVFRPQWWWIVSREGRDAGCLLLCRGSDAPACEVVYMGVAREFRGRGIGRAMLRRAAAAGRQAGCAMLRLAVDARNGPARKLYESEGFQAVDCRVAYAATAAETR